MKAGGWGVESYLKNNDNYETGRSKASKQQQSRIGGVSGVVVNLTKLFKCVKIGGQVLKQSRTDCLTTDSHAKNKPLSPCRHES